jgi:hypothetical protein
MRLGAISSSLGQDPYDAICAAIDYNAPLTDDRIAVGATIQKTVVAAMI